jgi:hypothetical protein
MRAVLLACATDPNRAGRRSSMPRSHAVAAVTVVRACWLELTMPGKMGMGFRLSST